MPVTASASLIAAQAQIYGAPKVQRGSTPPALEKLAARGSDNAVRVEISAEARRSDAARLEARAEQRSERRQAAERDFAREAPLREAQQNAGARITRPGTTLDIRI